MSKHLIHAHSVVVNEGNPKLPDTNRIEFGEIAVNYAKGYETLSIKNNNNEIVTFSSDDAVKKMINENERVVAESLNDLDTRIKNLQNLINTLNSKIDNIENNQG